LHICHNYIDILNVENYIVPTSRRPSAFGLDVERKSYDISPKFENPMIAFRKRFDQWRQIETLGIQPKLTLLTQIARPRSNARYRHSGLEGGENPGDGFHASPPSNAHFEFEAKPIMRLY
jgi:hypothetical protein